MGILRASELQLEVLKLKAEKLTWSSDTHACTETSADDKTLVEVLVSIVQFSSTGTPKRLLSCR